MIALLLLTCGVVHDAHRARLDPVHAQRVIGITGEGDHGLIALQACQAYIQEVSGTKSNIGNKP